jgi:hypothetical protein
MLSRLPLFQTASSPLPQLRYLATHSTATSRFIPGPNHVDDLVLYFSEKTLFPYAEGDYAGIRAVLDLYAANTGSMPVYVHNVSFGGHSQKAHSATNRNRAPRCSHGGFALSDCGGFTLEPGGSDRKLTVSFTPDFSSSRVAEVVVVSTSAGVFSYPITAILPHSMIGRH